MQYPMEMQEEGWRLVDPVLNITADFGGVPLEHLTLEEAHVMLELLQHRDRALVREAHEPDWLLRFPSLGDMAETGRPGPRLTAR